ncbi:MAG: thiamine-monophosphate kinase [Thermoguttaceae bacterium]|nr:thiamine-monophosphate kinase [Thermoguttaceae bacterium]
MKSEENLIRHFRRATESSPELTRALQRGIGDDAAILEKFPGNLVVTTDMLCDGIDFICGKDAPEEIGRKSLAVNLSDLAAMGAAPLAVVISVLLPLDAEKRIGPTAAFAERLFQGLLPTARKFAAAIAGGDTNAWHGDFAISITALGRVEPSRALLRSGARPGDRVLVTGGVGGSIFGRQFRFTPRILEALYLARNHEIHAAIDISDGLKLDAWRLARESGLVCDLDPASIPIHPDLLNPPPDAGRYPGWESEKPALEHALSDGEDFELVLAVPPDEAKRLVDTQPFLSAARGDEKTRRDLEALCREHRFRFTEEDFQKLAEVRLTEIGVFREGTPAETPSEAGWEYRF